MPRVSPAKIWCMTWNNYDEESVVVLMVLLKELRADFVIGREVAPTTGTPHIQACFRRAVKWRPLPALARAVGARAHFERARGAWWQNVKYCVKDGDWSSSHENPWGLVLANMPMVELREEEAERAARARAAVDAHWRARGRPVEDVSWEVPEFSSWVHAHEVLATRET